MSDAVYAVFVRFAGEKTAQRLTSSGSTTRRKVHAAQFTQERAQQVASEIEQTLNSRDDLDDVWFDRF